VYFMVIRDMKNIKIQQKVYLYIYFSGFFSIFKFLINLLDCLRYQ
jgi:hypothetical protein